MKMDAEILFRNLPESFSRSLASAPFCPSADGPGEVGSVENIFLLLLSLKMKFSGLIFQPRINADLRG